MVEFTIMEKELFFKDFSLPKNCPELKIAIAGITALIRSESEEIINGLRNTHDKFLSEKKADFLIEVAIDKDLAASIDAFTIKTLNAKNRLFVECRSMQGFADLKQGKCKARVGNPAALGIENFLRIAYSLQLIEFDGFLLHSCSYVKDNKGFVFFGKSGSGKSTIAKANLDKALVLSDDTSVVRKTGDSYKLFNSPIRALSKNETIKDGVAIDSIYLLKKDNKNFFRKMDKANAVNALLGSVFCLSKNKKTLTKVVELCYGLVNSVDCFEFHFAKETPCI